MTFGDLIERLDRAVQDRLGRVDVIYTPTEGDPVTAPGLFDENYVLQRPQHSAVENASPSVWLKLSDLHPYDPETDEPLIQIGSNYYRIRERQTDGIGGTVRFLLHRTEAPSP